jgi:hypothetical protein
MTTSLTTTRHPRRTNSLVAGAGAASVIALLFAFGPATTVWTDVFGNSDTAPANQAPGLTVPADSGGQVIEAPCFRMPPGGMGVDGGVPICESTIAP